MNKETSEEKAIKKTSEMLKDSGIYDWLMHNHGGLYVKIHFELEEIAILMFTNKYLAEEVREKQKQLFLYRNSLASKIGAAKAFLKPWEVRSKWIMHDYEVLSDMHRKESLEPVLDGKIKIINEQQEEKSEIKESLDLKATEASRSYRVKYNSSHKNLVKIATVIFLGCGILLLEYLFKIGLSFITIISLLVLVNGGTLFINGISKEQVSFFAIFAGISLIQYVSWYVYNEFFYHDGKFFTSKWGKTIFVLIYLSEAFLGYEGLIKMITPETLKQQAPLSFFHYLSVFLASGTFVMINILYAVSKAYKNKETVGRQSRLLALIESHKMSVISIIENMNLIDLHENRFQKYRAEFQSYLHEEGGLYDLINLTSINSYIEVNPKPIERPDNKMNAKSE